ncbi:uncharacterized protein LOC133295174 [Gastrolobium bilobum]|uniref:uncharacterized protein LOC133295174 n=1 Tax=Gastrolobium bilobum TaxID=150636 RepID=UPI002AB231C5|nr:uncharacterized protein LOC133295174 [Gastrolobium bilobum]
MDAFLMPSFTRPNSSITKPTIEANNFQIKSALVSLVQQSQFLEDDLENPHAHLERFLMICDTVKWNEVSDDALRLQLFLFSLKGEAFNWLEQQPANSISTWEDLAIKFLA